MPLPADFERESLYAPRSWYVHDLVALDRDAGRVVGVLHTTDLGSLVQDQIPHPAHPKHVPGAVLVQATGTLGLLHAVYVLDLRPSEGWAGYGIKIHQATFRSLGRIGPDVQLEAVATRCRQLRGTWFVDYRFRFEQEGRLLYASEQRAAWTRTPLDQDA